MRVQVDCWPLELGSDAVPQQSQAFYSGVHVIAFQNPAISSRDEYQNSLQE
jgi:hypothetical protein